MRIAHAAALTVLLTSGAASAHTLDVGTAKVTLRDAHIDVVAEWDLFLLTSTAPTAIATATEEELVAAHRALRTTIEAQTHLRVDGASQPLVLRGFPEPQELRALAATLSSEGQSHGARVRIRLESTSTFADAREVTLAVPPALGPVMTSFVQPASRFAMPGEAVTFDVLARPTPRQDAPARAEWVWAAYGALTGGALVALVAGARTRKRASPDGRTDGDSPASTVHAAATPSR